MLQARPPYHCRFTITGHCSVVGEDEDKRERGKCHHDLTENIKHFVGLDANVKQKEL